MVKTIAVSAEGPDLDARINPSLAQCTYLIFVDPDTLDFATVKNPAADVTRGAGVKAVEFVIWHGVTIILTGTIGATVKAILLPADVNVITEVSGMVRDAVLDYRDSLLQTTSCKTQQLHRHRSYGLS